MAKTRGIRDDAVSEWLASHVDGAVPPFEFHPIEGGHSNLTYRVTSSGGNFVLRRPPIGSILATAHDMGREHSIISALATTEIPVPPALGLCTDPAVNDAPFYVMAFIEGLVADDARVAKSEIREPDRSRLSRRVVEVLCALHAVDPDAVGLGDLGKKQDYLARQLKRWSRQWEGSKTRELEEMEEVSAALRELLPEQVGASIVHGDYRIGNMLISPQGDVCAVLDWELCTLGDPLADVGYLLNNWAAQGEVMPGAKGAELPPSAVEGFFSRSELLEHYAACSGRDVSDMPYYRAFQYWRSAAIVEGVLDRYLQGKMTGSLDTELYDRRVVGLARAALEAIRAL